MAKSESMTERKRVTCDVDKACAGKCCSVSKKVFITCDVNRHILDWVRECMTKRNRKSKSATAREQGTTEKTTTDVLVCWSAVIQAGADTVLPSGNRIEAGLVNQKALVEVDTAIAPCRPQFLPLVENERDWPCVPQWLQGCRYSGRETVGESGSR